MENPSVWSGLRWPIKAIIIAAPIVAIIWYAATHGLIPGLNSAESANVAKAQILKDEINVNSTSKKLAVPDVDQSELAEVAQRPQIRVMNWVWFANAGIFSANGGTNTMKGSLMDQYGACEPEDLMDLEKNFERIIWIAGNDIVENIR